MPIGAPLLVAVDETLFRRRGRKVWAAHWGYDGSPTVAKGNQKLSRGNTFVVAAVVVMLPFLDQPVALPVLARLWRKGGPAKTVLARELAEVIAPNINPKCLTSRPRKKSAPCNWPGLKQPHNRETRATHRNSSIGTRVRGDSVVPGS